MKKEKKLIIRITEEDDKIIKTLREKHSINISNIIRVFLREYYDQKKS